MKVFCTQDYMNTNLFIHIYLMNLFDLPNKLYVFHFNQENHQIKRLKLRYNGLEKDSSLLTQHASALGSSTGLEQGIRICPIETVLSSPIPLLLAAPIT